jgi:hypothetical protein
VTCEAMTVPTVTDGLWELLQPLLTTTPRRFRYPGRRMSLADQNPESIRS